MRYFLHFAISVACAEVLTQISFDKHLKEKNSWTVSTDCCKSCKFVTCEIALEICTSCREIGKWNELISSQKSSVWGIYHFALLEEIHKDTERKREKLHIKN
uniref:Uncharacterized protein n=1 Tax=Wuchereria bancrofti TaxID=6293 RepID=A0A1I8EI52_WUCBA